MALCIITVELTALYCSVYVLQVPNYLASTVRYRHADLVESYPFCTTPYLQLCFYRPLCYDSRAHCPLLQCLRTASAILAGAHSYFVVSFKYKVYFH
jgi:hypothetical protein